ncbi:MAG: amino acid adenylation domain-containing protein [Acutalibacteraceae bacterium]
MNNKKYVLTKTEYGIYFDFANNPKSTAYNIPQFLTFDKDTDVLKLKEAVEKAVEAHPYLKTRLSIDENGNVYKSICDEPVNVEIKEIRDADFNKSEYVYPFDLLKDCLCRFCVFRTESSVVLFCDIHHIIFDGFSLQLFMADIDRALSGQPLEVETYTGNDVSDEEARRLLTPELDEAKNYYNSVFGGLELESVPINDKNEGKPIAKKFRYDFNSFNADDIKNFAQAHSIKSSTFFTGVFGFVLAKFSGAEESLFSTIYNGRNKKLARSCGMFVKTLPVYCNSKKNDNTEQYLHDLDLQLDSNRKYDLYSYADICADMQISPKSLFAYQGNAWQSVNFGGKQIVIETIPSPDAKSSLTVEVFRLNGKFFATVEYRADLYNEESMQIFIRCYEKAVSEFLSKQNLSEVDITDREQLALIDSFNQTEKAYDTSKTVVDLFREQAQANPENTAVVYLDKHYTYRQVDEISDRIGGYISSLGIGREDVVSILIPRCEYMVIASLGALKSGAAYQPLDPSYPSERLEFMIKDADAKLLIADKSLLDRVPDYKGKVLLLDDIPTLPECDKLPESPKPEDLFIMLYTSGSTGIPKGCMLEHRNIASFCNWFRNYYNLTPQSKAAAYASYGFDANMMDTYPTLTSGAELHIIDEAIRLDLMAIEKYFNENEITHSFMTTQVGRQFALESNCKTLKYLSVGGEKLVPINADTNFKFNNLYGPTECTVCVTAFTVDKDYDRVPIGKALDNLKLYVVDKNGRILPPCVPGELWISGYGVSRGYLNRPEQNEKTFIKNPFTDEKGYERVYRTGDIVRYLPNGNIDFVGRNDGQVKIRGFRIELSEVEKVIREYDGIKDAAVIARKLPTGGQSINAYITADTKIDISRLNEFIESRKPYYMVPESTMQIDVIPLTVNGKVDKRKLLEIKPVAKSENKTDTPSKPLTMLEKKISEIVEKIIGHNEFSISDDLMHTGMNSLSVIKLAVALNKQFGYEANVRNMMKGCSVVSIENDLQEYLLSGSFLKPSHSAKEQKPHKAQYPLSKTQLGVYLDCMKNPYGTLYNIPSVLKFSKNINAEKLADSVKKVILAHPYIFTHITTQNDDVEQVYKENPTFDLTVEKLTESQFAQLKKDFVQPYSLVKAPLFRIKVVETDESIYLVTDFHHIVFDGGSLNIFMTQLKEVYEGGEIKSEEYTYFDYVENEVNAENGEEYKTAEKFFDDMLKNFESSSEITPDLSGIMENGKCAEAIIPFEMSAFENFCTDNGFTPAQLFLAGTFYAVSRFVNSRNVYLSTISNGRSDMRLTDCFGMFVKTLPIGIEVDDISSLEFVNRTKSVFTGAIENEIYPYAKICAKFGYAPNIMYEYQLGVTDNLTVDGNPVEKNYFEAEKTKFKASVCIESHDNKPCVVVRYNDALYSKELMQTLARSILNSTKHIVENPSGKIRNVSMLDDEQIKELKGFSSTLLAPVENEVLHKIFEKQAEKTPDRKAIVACDRTLTYSELNRLANITANELIARGFKKGGKAVVLLSRTSKIFTTIFGILKAGGAFIPTCPDYPKERIESIIEDSEADFVITEGELLDVYDKTTDVNTLLSGSNCETPNVDVKAEDLAYLIYTSGSTGKPKGVMLRHKGISNYITYSDANIHVKNIVDNCTAYGSVTTVSFDMSLKETVLSLCNGLTLVFASDEQTTNPVLLAQFLKENNVDVFNSTPSRLLQYMELDEFVEAMKNCKVILSGGEKYPDTLLKLLREKTDAKILNTYGPTEITVSSNCKNLTNACEISIGKPLMNYIEHIVDTDGNLIPIGVVGELLISGCGVALGYNKLPQQTEKAFIEYNGERTYRSGDYAKWTKNGDVIILGRTDNQVKLRGLRIELGEIEKCLSDIRGIKSAIALIRKVNKADAICAYYTAETQLDEEYIRNELKKTLTDYMIPTAYVQLDSMPLTPNGKINTKLLPEPVVADKNGGLEPSTQLERKLCDIFAKVLELDKVYADDNFFDIGGSSLTVTRVIILANKADIEISYGDVFANPTPKSLAKLLDKDNTNDEFEDLSKFDYTDINNLLKNNNLDSFKNGEMQETGDVLLTGAAGFLGIHILYELIHKYSGKIYCMLRDKNNNPAENRLNTVFYYYFEESLKEKYSDRVTVLNGDVTDRKSFDKFLQYKIDTVINCAANVKHFSKGTDIEDVNLYGALNVIDFCKQANARLIHVSTMSVGGIFAGKQGEVDHLEETQLYFGQQESSKYTMSKFLAERAILDEVSKGFNAKIMRVGTLAARNSDGEYQINFTTNTFMGRLKSNLIIGKYPYDMIEMPFELSPIDFVAKAILLLAQTPKECTVFHPFNNHTLMMGDLYMEMDKMGLHSEPSENEEYEQALENAKQNPEKAKILSSMIAYQNMAHGQKIFVVSKSNKYTMQILYRMGFRWTVTSLDYMKRFIQALKGLGFFDFE